jgi:2-polyprenyl-3-methyl-5-hydroxy-6-metoxy-1,4-benzoquinol methylase
MGKKRIAIFIVAYNAASTIINVLERIPKDVWEMVEEVFIFDDDSHDKTQTIAEEWKNFNGVDKLTVVKNPVNQGYGGNQKLGYQYAINKGYDIVVLLHGDGQYTPEVLPELLKPLIEDKAEAVFGSRMLTKGTARAGGMPLYKYIGNKILTKFENLSTGAKLSEWHSGYRIYSTKALKDIAFQLNTNDFHFDSEIIIQFLDNNFRIVEIPIPTYYGDEICYVNGLKYAGNLLKVIARYKMHKIGIKSYPNFVSKKNNYEIKNSPYSSHSLILNSIENDSKVLDLGCEKDFAKKLVDKGCSVVGVNDHFVDVEGLKNFFVHDLEQRLIITENEKFDYIILADVLEHLKNSKNLLEDCKKYLKPNGKIIVSTGNVALWVMRLSLLFGNFNYARRGILDETHVHLYTFKSFRSLIENSDLEILDIKTTTIPFELLFPKHSKSWFVKIISQIYFFLANIWKSFFAYQFILVVKNKEKKEILLKIENF